MKWTLLPVEVKWLNECEEIVGYKLTPEEKCVMIRLYWKLFSNK